MTPAEPPRCAGSQGERSMIDLKKYTRNRCVGWLTKELVAKAKAAGIKDVEPNKGLYSNDLMDDQGNLMTDLISLYGVDPASVRPITVEDLPAEYREGAKSATKKLTEEWNAGASAENQMSENEVVWHLVLNARR